MPDVRAHRRCGRGGKRTQTLDWIEHYWDQIEGDFFDRGVDARDFFRGTRPWDQFHNYVKTLGLTEGSQFWAAQLSDVRFDEELEEKLAAIKQQRESEPPSLVGYTRTIAAIDELTDHIHSLRAESGRWSHAPKQRVKPKFPLDRIEDRKIALSRGLVDNVLAEAHALVTRNGNTAERG
jgi:hypothetical protein